ncbi:MAG: hypothetical protein KDA86_02415 [Planctomycetaceae bacterium]|nr:hypothetical protein [Planctomycetaceae bacterium]
MIKASTFILLLTIAVVSMPGCAAMKSSASQAMTSMRPGNGDYHDTTGDSSDPWVQEAGAEARVNHPREKDPEPPWMRNFLMSQKARDIESNLGIE